MRLAITPWWTVHWLFRSHDLPSKFSPIASCLCDRCNRAVKHMHVSPLLRNFVVVSAVLLVSNFVLRRQHMDHTDLKILMLLYENKLYAIHQHVNLLSWVCNSSACELAFLNYQNLTQECSVFCSFSCSCIPLYPEELSSADLMHHMHIWLGGDTGQPGSERRSRSAEHSVNTPECPQISCMPHDYRALGCKGGCGSVYRLRARANPVIKS